MVWYLQFLVYFGLKVSIMWARTLRCVIPVVCVTNEREGKVVEQHN